jgi:hypothetical protein
MNRERNKGDRINKEGARRCQEGVREHARSGASRDEAREAARALDSPEGGELRRAERAGKAAAKLPRR